MYDLCLNLSEYTITLSGADIAVYGIYIDAKNIDLTSGYSFLSEEGLVFIASEGIILSNASIIGGAVWM